MDSGVLVNVSQWVARVAEVMQSADLHFGHGTDNPHDEAVWLVLRKLGLPLDGTCQSWELPVDEAFEASILQALSERVGRRVPLAYVLGSAWFAGLEFEVSPSVLVPRSPVAELILEGFQPWIPKNQLRDVLDLCTGSGCIGIAIAVYFPDSRVDASDLSSEALQIAQRNIEKHGVQSRVSLYQSDLFAALPRHRYDLVISNPPYVPVAGLRELPNEYRAEPALGLVSGEDGLDACLQIMLQSPMYLQPEGNLICEVGESAELLADSFPSVPFTWLEFSQGGSGVFLLSQRELEAATGAVAGLIEDRKNVA